jgi:DNA repair protein RecN (Recombination protein N)
MLESLRIRNFALIERAEIPFGPGLNVLSGETGAGKSIALEAIGLVLGGRASGDLIRTGCDEASVEAVFDITDRKDLLDRLSTAGIDADDSSQLIIKRVVQRSGKNRVWLNAQATTVQVLQNVCQDVIDLCSQHEHQSLFRPEAQTEWIDRYAKTLEASEKLRAEYQRYCVLADKIQNLKIEDESKAQRLDYLKFQDEEIRTLSPVVGEDETLSERKKLLQTEDSRRSVVDELLRVLDSESEGVIDSAKLALSKGKSIEALDSSASAIRESLERAVLEVEEARRACAHYADQIESDPGELDRVQERLSGLNALKRKFGSDLQAVIQAWEQIKTEIHALENVEESRAALLKEQALLTPQLKSHAVDLRKKRTLAAKKFSEAVTAELHELKMEQSEFYVDVAAEDAIEDWSSFGLGSKIQYRIRTNAGEDAKPLAKIASGGELSRIMLSTRRVLADRGRIGVYLFDEIDAGIGGQTAFSVGKKLRSVSKHNQVICITHVPQVACFADHHLSVSKKVVSGKTTSTIQQLGKAERIDELARMLGADDLTATARKNAKELVERALGMTY